MAKKLIKPKDLGEANLNAKAYKAKVKQRAVTANKILKEMREDHPNFFDKRWGAVIEDIGTKRGEFKTGTSKMNLEQLNLYEQQLAEFMNNAVSYRESYYNLVSIAGSEIVANLWERALDRLESELFKYFIPSKTEHNYIFETTKLVVNNMFRDEELLQRIGVQGVLNFVLGKMTKYGAESRELRNNADYNAFLDDLSTSDPLRRSSLDNINDWRLR